MSVQVPRYRGWESVAVLTPLADEQLDQVQVCDWNPIDDPLSPHASLIYFYGVRRRNSMNHTITIWRLSTLSGQLQRVHDFEYKDPVPHLKCRQIRFLAFQSGGVLFVFCRQAIAHMWMPAFLFVYDTRFEVAAKFKFKGEHKDLHPAAILCIGRRTDDGENVSGWKIRYIGGCQFFHGTMGRCWRVVNIVFNLAAFEMIPKWCKMVHHEDILRRLPAVARSFGILQSSQRSYGFHWNEGAAEPTFVFDAKANQFRVYESRNPSFAATDPMLIRYWKRVSHPWRLCPFVLSEREAIAMLPMGTVLRTAFQPSTLRMVAASRLFRSNPGLENRMDADEFRRSTGVDLKGHFFPPPPCVALE